MDPSFKCWCRWGPYKCTLTGGVNLNKSLLFRYFDPFFIHILVENNNLFIY